MNESIFTKVEDLSCDAIDAKPVDFDFGEGFAETWDIVYPDPSDWSLEECKDWLRDKGYGCPIPDSWDMSRDELAAALTEVGIQVYDHETEETLRAAVVANIDDETIDGLDEWRERYASSPTPAMKSANTLATGTASPSPKPAAGV